MGIVEAIKMMTVDYCVHSIKTNEVVCDACREYVLNLAPDHSSFATLTSLREFKKRSLEHVTGRTFDMMLKYS